MPLDDEHHKAAIEVLSCYDAMELSKRQHFDFLSQLEEQKQKFNIDPRAADRDTLATLLSEHDQNVAAFRSASARLKADNPRAHLAVFQYIAERNSSDSATQPDQQH